MPYVGVLFHIKRQDNPLPLIGLHRTWLGEAPTDDNSRRCGILEYDDYSETVGLLVDTYLASMYLDPVEDMTIDPRSIWPDVACARVYFDEDAAQFIVIANASLLQTPDFVAKVIKIFELPEHMAHIQVNPTCKQNLFNLAGLCEEKHYVFYKRSPAGSKLGA